MGFQAWLGKTVVDSNLLPFKITVHMVMALVIVALLLYLYFISKPQATLPKLNSRIKQMAVFALVLTLVQIAMGTQVRQFVDEQSTVWRKRRFPLARSSSPTFLCTPQLLPLGYCIECHFVFKLKKMGLPAAVHAVCIGTHWPRNTHGNCHVLFRFPL